VEPSGFLCYSSDVLTLHATKIMDVPETPGLLKRARAGDAEAFVALCRALEGRLFRQAIVLCGNEAMAEDLAQDTLVEAWKSIRSYNGGCQFFTWLCAILLHRHRNTLRKRRPWAFSFLAGGARDEADRAEETLVDSADAPDQEAERHEQAALVRACLQALPVKHQQVVYLRFYAGDSLEGIAAALDCSVGTVKSRLFHALEKLRKMNLLASHSSNHSTKSREL